MKSLDSKMEKLGSRSIYPSKKPKISPKPILSFFKKKSNNKEKSGRDWFKCIAEPETPVPNNSFLQVGEAFLYRKKKRLTAIL